MEYKKKMTSTMATTTQNFPLEIAVDVYDRSIFWQKICPRVEKKKPHTYIIVIPIHSWLRWESKNKISTYSSQLLFHFNSSFWTIQICIQYYNRYARRTWVILANWRRNSLFIIRLNRNVDITYNLIYNLKSLQPKS